jgi:hypothetical protein
MAKIMVYANDIRGKLPRLERYWNTSLRFAPSRAILDRAVAQFGPARMIRAWITLDEMWDYRDDSYHFNYRIGRNRYADDDAIDGYDRKRTAESEVDYYDYLDAVSASTDEILLCFRRYEHEAFNGTIGFEKYRQVLKAGLKHYLQRAANITAIEPCNEWAYGHFGGLDHDQYYRIYAETCRIAAELEDELALDKPLRIGGPASATAHFDHVGQFLRRLARDKAEHKRLDFISLHDYSSGERPVRVQNLRGRLDAWLVEHALPLETPIYVTEMGSHEGGKFGGEGRHAASNLVQAAGVFALQEQLRRAGYMTGFPWCLHHDPDVQTWSTQILPDGRLTPHGMVHRMRSMHRANELATESDGVNVDGLGVYALASADDEAAVIQAVNFSARPALAEVGVVGLGKLLSAGGRVEHFLVDSHDNNGLADPEASPDLEADTAGPLGTKHQLALGAELEPYGAALWRIRRNERP